KKKEVPEGREKADGEAGHADEAPIVIPPGSYLAELTDWKGNKFESSSGDDCAAIVEDLRKRTFVVSKIEQKDRAERPQAPFTTRHDDAARTAVVRRHRRRQRRSRRPDHLHAYR